VGISLSFLNQLTPYSIILKRNKITLHQEIPPRLVAIGRLYPGGSTMHIVQMSDDLARVVVEDVRDATTPVPVPTEEVKIVGEALGTFISWPKQLVKVI